MTFSEEEFAKLRQVYQEAGQGQVFRFEDQLSKQQKAELFANLSAVDPVQVNKNFASIAEREKEQATEVISVFNGQTKVIYEAPPDEQAKYRANGLEMIRNGQVGAVLMAGGQGTRLGSDQPKGMYDLQLPSGKSLFQLQAEKIQRLKSLAGGSASLPWYIQTSDATHNATVDFFKQNSYFGLPPKDVFIFQQGLLPALSLDGKILLSSATALAMAPNGNGGLHAAIASSGALADMCERKLQYIHVYGVDNVLVKVADPSFMAFCSEAKADCANKVIVKTDPEERVGVMSLRSGKPGVVEYSEITKAMSEQRDPQTGQLLYSGANIAQHAFSVSFMKEVACSAFLPFHVAKKAIPVANKEGKTEAPGSINGIKMEMFVFDVFAFAKNMVCYACKREEEFTAVKNKPIPGQHVKDSPVTARMDYSAYHASLVAKAGGTVLPSDTPEKDAFEISPLVSYDGEGLEQLVKGKTFTAPFHLA